MDRLIFELTASALAGFGLGVFFFGGLLWTLRRLGDGTHVASRLIASFAIRTSVAVTAFIVIVWLLGPAALGLALLGFVIARFVVVRRAGAGLTTATRTRPEAREDAP